MTGSDPINVIDPGWAWDDNYSFSPALKAAGLIYVSGQLALDANGKLVGEGSVEAQSRQIFGNIETILRAAGSSMQRVLRLVCYCVDFSDYAAYSKVRSEIFAQRYPASTTVGVASLLVPGALLEIDVIALAGDTLEAAT